MQIEYKLERKRRKTISIKIVDGHVIVSAPPRTEKYEIEYFLQSKKNWIIKNLNKQRLGLSCLSKFDDNETLLFGSKTCIPDKFKNNRFAFYKSQSDYLTKRIKYISDAYGFTYSGLRFSRAQTRWGSCNGNNSITLNYALLALPERLSDYVIIHELSHTRYHDHSTHFWKQVGELLPDYKALRKELKDYAYVLKFIK